MIIAIDGPAASGKGTVARRVADALGLAYLDTGLLYRAVGRAVLDVNGDPADDTAAGKAARTLTADALNREGLRTEEAGQAASKVAAIPSVRKALLDFQRQFAAAPPAGYKGAVLDGRDIGTVVCPDAPVKLFVTASAPVRANRRFKQLQAADPAVIYERVLQDLQERDARDQGRDTAPLTPACDALILQTDHLDAEAVFARVMAHIAAKTGQPAET